MQVFTDIQHITNNTPSIVTIGNFDGVHLGHQKLIYSVVEKAKASSMQSVAITFSPHPEHFFHPDTAPPLLMSLEAKLSALSQLGIDTALVLPFDTNFARQTPEYFVQSILVEVLHTKHLVIGYDYAFGKARSGNATMLENLGKTYGFTFEQLEPVLLEGEIISSTRIRHAITTGDIVTAEKLLGRPHVLEGLVVHGKNRGGKLLGFPTANTDFTQGIVAPKPGVYAVQTKLFTNPRDAYAEGVAEGLAETLSLNGVASIGFNPTFGDVPFTLEIYLLDFDQDIYDWHLQAFFIKRLRDEVKFSSIYGLIRQITEDVTLAREILEKREKRQHL